jgi:hypothetical protein
MHDTAMTKLLLGRVRAESKCGKCSEVTGHSADDVKTSPDNVEGCYVADEVTAGATGKEADARIRNRSWKAEVA